MFVELDDYPALLALRKAWREVAGELERLQGERFVAWPERFLYRGDWQVFPLYKFGQKVEDCCGLCPQTTVLVEAVPGMVTAGFSRMLPGTHIEPHKGYTGKVLRFHLGLTEAEECGLRVGTETRTWFPGSAFIFDDTVEHEAWNRGDRERTILLLDFKRDPSAVLHILPILRNLDAS
ncbi:MAG: aspartyl/asparaginyl beta-hydroxylase domain-containing protein [Pseudomonadota bacterium]